MSRLRSLWPYAALSLFALLAAEPLARAQMTCSDDGPFHLFRAVELGALLRAGHLFPRWAPHMAQGYGYPFFNFYAPLSSYIVVLLNALGLAYPAALKAAFGLGLWLAGLAACLFVRTLWGSRAGVAAGVAYAFAPYLAYDVLFRANLAESFAFIWPPLVLWSLHEAAHADEVSRHRPLLAVRWLLPGLFYAALILTHNIFALIASPLFAGYAALLAFQRRSWPSLGRAGLALMLGVGLTAYFWLPALAERELVHSDRLLVPPIFTWHTNFISPGELLAPPRAEDPRLINPSPPRALGLVTALLCLPALSAFFRRKGARAPGDGSPEAPSPGPLQLSRLTTTAFFSIALLGYGLLALPASTPVWRLIRPLELVQFPWRMLGPASLCAAVLVGAGGRQIESALAGQKWASLVLPALVSLLFVGNLAWWYPRYCPAPATASIADLVAYERGTHTIGTTAKGEYLPRTAAGVPADETIALGLLAGQEPSRLSLSSPAAQVDSASVADPLDAAFVISSASGTPAVYRQFYYPGWRVSVDGQPVPATPEAGTGLIAFDVPPGTHTLRVSFGHTPLRAAAAAISLAALAACLAVVSGNVGRRFGASLREARRGARPSTAFGMLNRPEATDTSVRRPLASHEIQPAAVDGGRGAVWILGFFGLLLAIKVIVIDRVPNPLRQAGAAVPHGQVPLRADFAGGIRLHGYDLSSRAIPSDGAADVALYVTAREPVQRRFWPGLTVLDAGGLSWHAPDALPPRWHREPPHTPLWPVEPEAYAQWARHVSLLPGTPPGTYDLTGEVFDLDSLQIASLLDEQGNAVAPRFSLGSLTVTRPRQPAVLQPEHEAARAFGPISLLGYNLSTGALNAGDSLVLTLYWQAGAPMAQDLSARVTLVDSGGRPALEVELPPVASYPTSHWEPGDSWRGQHRLRLPAALADGSYHFELSVAGAAGRQRLGSLELTAPRRIFARPPVAAESGAEFGLVGVLEGYDLELAGESLTVTLVWRASQTPPASYTAFVHLADESGRVWAQSDAVPAGWTRPTTGWLAGEYVADAHTLRLPAGLPPGAYDLWVGMYEPQTGARVPAAGPGAAPDQRVWIGAVDLP